jgi:peptide deformylase
MAVCSILRWPDKRLRTAAAPVEQVTEDIHAIWADMVDTMDAMLRLAVVDVTPDRSRRILLANPDVLSSSDEQEPGTEASPCLPGVHAEIMRPKAIAVRFLNDKGIYDRRDFTGLEARSVLHQIDHLAGRMYFDALGRVKRDMLLRRARKVG